MTVPLDWMKMAEKFFSRAENAVGNGEIAVSIFFFFHGVLTLSQTSPCFYESEDKINVTEKLKFVLEKLENMVGKGRKCWLPGFSLFPIMFSKAFLYRVVKNQDCVVKS